MGFDTSADNDVIISSGSISKKIEHSYPLPGGGSVKATSTRGQGIHLDVFEGRQQVLSIDKDGRVKHTRTAEEKKLSDEIFEFYRGLIRDLGSPPPANSNNILDTKA
jgi:hypothetical protein